MAQNNHNKYVSYPDWFENKQQTTSVTQTTSTTTMGPSVSSSGGSSVGLTSVQITGSGNAVTSGSINGDTLTLNKDLTFLTDAPSGSSYWEIRTDQNGKEYLYANYDVATLGGIVSYVNNGDLNVSTIYDGLPIDFDTLYWAETDKGKILKAKASAGGSGGSDVSADWVLLIVNNAGYVTESWINSQDFINSTTLNNTLFDYVTKNTDQQITGIKDFKNGLLINGTAIKPYQNVNETIYIDGNLVVKGGLTMFAGSADLDLPNIYEGLPIDNVTIYWERNNDGEYVLKSAASSTGGGVADKIDW